MCTLLFYLKEKWIQLELFGNFKFFFYQNTVFVIIYIS